MLANAGQPGDDQRDRLLDAAEELFYARGVQAVGMDEIRATSGLALKRIYQLYPGGKDELMIAFLDRRDRAWRGRLAAHVAIEHAPAQRVLAVFDWLGRWFAEPGFRGCAWINAYGEFGPTVPAVAQAVRDHKLAFRRYVSELVAEAGHPATVAHAVYLLAEGAIVTAGIDQQTEAAVQARQGAALLLRAG